MITKIRECIYILNFESHQSCASVNRLAGEVKKPHLSRIKMELTFSNRAMSHSKRLGADCLQAYLSRTISTKALKIVLTIRSATIGRGLVL